MIYEIGSIVYILFTNKEKETKIYPAIVDEQIIKRKTDGEQVSYIVMLGPPNKRQKVDMNRIGGELFPSLDDLKHFMVSNFEKYVDGLCGEATKESVTWYGKRELKQQSVLDMPSSEKLDPAAIIGSPTSLSSPPIPVVASDRQTLREQLKAAVQISPEELSQESTEERMVEGSHDGPVVEMPDGSIRRIRGIG